MEKKIIGFSLNFDWLSSVIEVDDIENLENIDRLLCEETDELLNYIVDKGGRVSIFVIGKDLMRPIIAKYIKKWFEDGHEIGNHSWSHPVNFGELSQSEIKEEIFKTASGYRSCKRCIYLQAPQGRQWFHPYSSQCSRA